MENYIYTLETNNKIFYIGKTTDIKTRLRKHISESKKKRTYKENFINKTINDGYTIEIKILDTVDSNSVDFFEIYWISQFKQWGFNLCNTSNGGEGGSNFKGKKHTEETKKILRAHKYKQIELNGVRIFSGEDNGRCKLNNQIVLEIRRLRDEKSTPYSKLAIQFKISKTQVIDIIKRRKWKHI